MDLILWRHADAQDGSPDLARELTPKGQRQAADMAKWLKRHLPEHAQVLVSSAVRAQQTARAFSHNVRTVAQIGPGASYEAVLAAAGWPNHTATVVIVGHQPTLGQTAAWLLSGAVADWSMKKGAIWWFTSRRQGESVQTALHAVMSCDLL